MRRMDALPEIVTQNLAAIRALCEKHHVKQLILFGSAVKGEFRPGQSDIDFVVGFLPDAEGRGFHHPYFLLETDLRDLLHLDVDLVEPGTIRNPYVAESIRRAQLAIYDAA
jgi:predicted nucleotidyltransferase